jgi:hypothetical protein
MTFISRKALIENFQQEVVRSCDILSCSSLMQFLDHQKAAADADERSKLEIKKREITLKE